MGKQEKYKKYKKQEDNRDIFDKVLDNAPTIGAYGGAVLGGALGAKLASRSSRKWAKKNNWSKKDTDEISRGEAFTMAVPSSVAGMMAGGFAGKEIKGYGKRRK